MQARDRLIALAATIHLAIAALYAPHLPVEDYIPAGLNRALAVYGGFTGTHSRFDFFAPAVSKQARADFLVIPESGAPRRVRFATPSAEANRRLGYMFTLYAYPSERERLLQAWGSYLLRLNPDAVAVEARVEVLEIPTLQESAAGMAPAWVEVGRAKVRRGGAPGR
jgi:hypothetical protein